MLQRLTSMRYILSRKEQISYFCQRRVSALENPEKRSCFRIFDRKLTEEGRVK